MKFFLKSNTYFRNINFIYYENKNLISINFSIYRLIN